MTLNFIIFHTVPLLISRKIALHFFAWKRGWKKKGRHACCLWEKFWGKFFGKRNENFWKRCLKAEDVSCGEKNENASDNTLEKGACRNCSHGKDRKNFGNLTHYYYLRLKNTHLCIFVYLKGKCITFLAPPPLRPVLPTFPF